MAPFFLTVCLCVLLNLVQCVIFDYFYSYLLNKFVNQQSLFFFYSSTQQPVVRLRLLNGISSGDVWSANSLTSISLWRNSIFRNQGSLY